MTDSSQHRVSRFVGALAGVHAGDSLGATVEFRSWESIHAQFPDGLREVIGGGTFDWPAGHATDDTDLTRAVLLGYLDRGQAPNNGSDAIDLARRCHRDPTRSGAGLGQTGNGSLMRCIPTALARSAAAEASVRTAEAMAISAITHDDPRCTLACAAYVEAVAQLLEGARSADAWRASAELARNTAAPDDAAHLVADAITVAEHLSLDEMARDGRIDAVGAGSGYVLHGLTIAFTALLHERSLEQVLIDVVRIGSDTNAAIAGGLVGAHHGIGAIAARWLQTLQFREEFDAAARELATWSQPQ